MIYYFFLHIIVFLLYVIMGIYLLYKMPQGKSNRIFFVLCLLFANWALCDGFAYAVKTIEEASVWYDIGVIAWTFSPAVLLHFFIVLSEHKYKLLNNRIVIVLFYIPAAFFFYFQIKHNLMMKGFVFTSYGWRELVNKESRFSYLYDLYYIIYVIYGLILIKRWGNRSTNVSIKRQSRVIVVSGAMTVIGAALSDRFFPIVGMNVTPPIASIMVIVWLFGIFYSVIKYKLMVLTPYVALPYVMKSMSDGLVLLDLDGKIVYSNESARNLFGEIIGKRIGDIFGNDIVKYISLDEISAQKGYIRKEFSYKFKGEEIFLNISIHAIFDDFAQATGFVILMHDITELKRVEKKLFYYATHDSLTELPSRFLLNDRLRNAIARAVRYNHFIAVVLMDLDNFKEVNDTYGHWAGDILLQEVAKRLSKNVRESDTVARYGGDEFVIVLTDIDDMVHVPKIVSRIVDSISNPIYLGGNKIEVSSSFGISIFPKDGNDIDTLLKVADVRMYKSKNERRKRKV